VANALVACGACPSCRRGDDHVCAQRQLFGMHRPGAFAEYVAVPERSLIPWPDSVPAEAACLAEPLGNGVHMVELTSALSPETVLVIGAGPIGLLAMQAYRAIAGARVVVADLSPERLELARALGAEQTIAAGATDVIAAAQAATGGDGPDVVVDAVGIERTKQQSLAAVRAAGAVVWIGLGQDEIRVPSFAITLREIQVHGTYGARIDDLRVATALLASGAVSTRSWTKTAGLPEGAALFRRMLAAQGDDIKGVLLP
jgi:L-iditol 2-dehydrogenase